MRPTSPPTRSPWRALACISNTRESRRIDYALASDFWAQAAVASEPLHDWDNALPSYDHFSVVACLATRRGQRSGPRAFLVYDGQRLRRP